MPANAAMPPVWSAFAALSAATIHEAARLPDSGSMAITGHGTAAVPKTKASRKARAQGEESSLPAASG